MEPLGVRVVAPSRVGVGEPFAMKVKVLGPIHKIDSAGGWNDRKPTLRGPFNLNVQRQIHYHDNCPAEWTGRLGVEAGGDIFALGTPVDAGGWKIGVRHPVLPEKLAGIIFLKDQAVATSGNYENFVLINNRKYGHLFDPEEGTPGNRMLSATVTASSAMNADVLATTSFLKGIENGARFIMTQQTAERLFITQKEGNNITYHSSENFPAVSSA